MTRIAIIGNAGGGKSTVARKLRGMLGLPLHAIDDLQWRPGWRPAPKEEVAAVHGKLLEQERWIIDGWGDFALIEERFQRADTIILIDYPLWRHYWWALKRQAVCVFRPRIDGPAGCPMLPMTLPLLKMIRAIDRHAMPTLRALVDKERAGTRVVRIQSAGDLRAFLCEAERVVREAA